MPRRSSVSDGEIACQWFLNFPVRISSAQWVEEGEIIKIKANLTVDYNNIVGFWRCKSSVLEIIDSSLMDGFIEFFLGETRRHQLPPERGVYGGGISNLHEISIAPLKISK